MNELPAGVPFTTSDCLKFGARNSVDQALFRLVRSGYIIRLARGVFTRGDTDAPLPSAFEIARAKALAFGRKIFPHSADLAAKFKLVTRGNERTTFYVHSRTTSFDTVHGRIHFIGTTPRRTCDTPGKAKEVIQALWHLGKQDISGKTVETATLDFTRQEREELHLSGGLIPEWLADRVCRVYRWPGSLKPKWMEKQA